MNKKTLLALAIASSVALAGCSSSNDAGGSGHDNDHVVDRPVPDLPVDRPEPVDPDYGFTPEDNVPDRPEPDFGDTPDWGNVIGDIHVDGDGVIRFEGNEYQIVGYSDMDREFTIINSDGETLYARMLDDGRVGVIYNGQTFFFNGTRFAFTPDYDFGVGTDLDYISKDDITNILNLQKEQIKLLNQDELVGEYLKYASGIHYNQEKMEQAAYDVVSHYLLSDDQLDDQHKLGLLAFSFNGNVSIAHSIVVDALKHIDNTATDAEKQKLLNYVNGQLNTSHESVQQLYEGVYKHGRDLLDRMGVDGNEGNRYTLALIRNIQRHGWDHVKGKLEEHIQNNPRPMMMNTPQHNVDQNRVRSTIRNRVSQ